MRPLSLFPAVLLAALPLLAQEPPPAPPSAPAPLPTIAARTTNMTRMFGLLSLDWDAKAGKLYIEIPTPTQAATAPTSSTPTPCPTAPAPTTSASIAARSRAASIVHFQRTGPNVLLVEPNQMLPLLLR